MKPVAIFDLDGDELTLQVAFASEGHYSKGFWINCDPKGVVFFKLEQFRKLNEACLAAIAHLEALEKEGN